MQCKKGFSDTAIHCSPVRPVMFSEYIFSKKYISERMKKRNKHLSFAEVVL